MAWMILNEVQQWQNMQFKFISKFVVLKGKKMPWGVKWNLQYAICMSWWKKMLRIRSNIELETIELRLDVTKFICSHHLSVISMIIWPVRNRFTSEEESKLWQNYFGSHHCCHWRAWLNHAYWVYDIKMVRKCHLELSIMRLIWIKANA